ncbi:rubrerythrin family protein [Candidatus Sulfurimonas baltica]|uniref:Rubrerythrin family protein n=1 Tax=Candidatus Sulfurimonas baltica TaxID=2740404 RepID=A0A7S7LVP1_9BACT|nr:rubrerythrin family protein [Candidatus Sulfurimonas baltica]QOY52177.1 rubrerythrin family protein [Candidatus Sulfurimonas baltica]
MPTTNENLDTAFCGESQAYQKYSAFAKKAQKDGFENIAKLFRTTAEAEKIHAEGHLKAMDKVGSTIENLEAAIGGETYEFEDMYPPMHEQAVKDNHKAKKMFGYALEAEKVHAELYQKALQAVRDGKDLDEVNIYLCPTCGYIELGTLPEKCPVCGVPGSTFTQI